MWRRVSGITADDADRLAADEAGLEAGGVDAEEEPDVDEG